MLISKGAVAGSRTAARLLRAARAGPLHLQRKLIRPTHSNSQLRKKAIAAATPGSRSDNSDRASSKTYDVPVASESIDIYTFLSKVQKGYIDLQPEYQRDFEWELPACSKFIETILLRLPFHDVWLHEVSPMHQEVVDGQQRLTTIKAFKEGKLPNHQKFKLQGLEDLDELNGKTFEDLPQDRQAIFEYCKISMRIVQAKADEDGLFELYTRMNTGSKNHSKQQNRRAIFRGSYMKMLDKLAKDHMAQLKDPKIPFKQDEDREYILRFFAFHNNLKNFKPSLHQFLNAEIRPNRNLSADAIQQYEARFRKTLSLAVGTYGTKVFQRHNGLKYHGAEFDATLWDTIMLTLEGYDRADLQPHAGALRTKLLRLKADSAFVPKAGEKLSRKTIEARIRVFQNSIYAVIGSQRHAFQPRLFSPELKAEMFAANSECAECKQQILRLEDAQVDHIVPFAEGGNTESSNAQLLHSHCNQQKSNRLRLDRVWRS